MPTAALTAALVDRLRRKPPKTGRAEYWDEKTPGLCLRVSANGAATWTLRYRPRDGGPQRRASLGALPAVGLADAREHAARLRLDVAKGADPQHERMARRAAAANTFTFDRLAQRYLDEYAKPRKASWRNDESYLKRPREAWGKRDAATISRRDAIELLDEIKRTAPVSANRTHSVLVTLFNWAVEDQLLDATPIAGLKKRAVEGSKDRTLSDAEIKVLWPALATGNGMLDDVALALKALLLTCQRPGEIVGARQSELVDLGDPAKARWEIPAERMKARRPHVVPLAPMARALFRDAVARRRAQGDTVGVFGSRFSNRDTLARHSLSRALQRVIAHLDRRHGAAVSLADKPPTPHDFRRTVGTGLSQLGIAREDRMAVLAHVAGDIHGQVYDKYERVKEKRAALVAWERHVTALIGRGHEVSRVATGRCCGAAETGRHS
jgi:integrase